MRGLRQESNQFLDLAVIKTCFLSTDFSMLFISLADKCFFSYYLLGAAELSLSAPQSTVVCPLRGPGVSMDREAKGRRLLEGGQPQILSLAPLQHLHHFLFGQSPGVQPCQRAASFPMPTLQPYWSPLGLSQRDAESRAHIVPGGKQLNPTQSVCGDSGLEAGQKGDLFFLEDRQKGDLS